MDNIFWKGLQLVIFDVDGTLYEQSGLRKTMLLRLMAYYVIRPWRYKDLIILYHFRKEREAKAGFEGLDLEEQQYVWCATKADCTLAEVKRVVAKWIFKAPNRYLKANMYPGVGQFMAALQKEGIRTAVYSDYDAADKLRNMGLTVDFAISSTDRRVDSFKPLPKGVSVILSVLCVEDKSNCLFIGDRYELDGICAQNAGIPFLLVNKEDAAKDLYLKLCKEMFRARI